MALFTAGQKIRASQLNVGLGTYSRYVGTSTALAVGGNAVPFATLSQGSGAGLTVSGGNTTFTLAAGCWHVEFGAVVDQTSHTGVTGAFFALATNASLPSGSAYAETNIGVALGQVAGTISADIESDGTFVVIPVIFLVGAASVITLGSGLAPRLTFKQVND